MFTIHNNVSYIMKIFSIKFHFQFKHSRVMFCCLQLKRIYLKPVKTKHISIRDWERSKSVPFDWCKCIYFDNKYTEQFKINI